MQVSKWGNSLAIRLPAAVVEGLEFKEGDEIEIYIAGDRKFEVTRNKSCQRALEAAQALESRAATWIYFQPRSGE